MSMMSVEEVMQHLPHRYPFLLIDRVLEFEPRQSMCALKNVTFNEPFFQGHFPDHPIMPGVLIIEALAQVTGLLAFRSEERKAERTSLYYLVGIDKARFKQPVVPGDQLILRVELGRVKRNIWVFKGTATVDDKVVASADLMCTERDIDS